MSRVYLLPAPIGIVVLAIAVALACFLGDRLLAPRQRLDPNLKAPRLERENQNLMLRQSPDSSRLCVLVLTALEDGKWGANEFRGHDGRSSLTAIRY